VLRREGCEPPQRLLSLTLGGDGTPATALIRGDDDMHEPLEEVPFAGAASPPGKLERLVCLEELTGPCEPETALIRG